MTTYTAAEIADLAKARGYTAIENCLTNDRLTLAALAKHCESSFRPAWASGCLIESRGSARVAWRLLTEGQE